MTSFQNADIARRIKARPVIGFASRALATALLFSPLVLNEARALTLIAPGLKSAAPDLAEPVQFRRGFAGGGIAVGPRGGAIARRGYVARGPRGAIAGGGYIARGPRGNVVAGRGAVVRPGYPVQPWVRPAGYWWHPGLAVASGAALGFATAAAATAYANSRPPAPGYCWFYTDPARTQGFWDVCPP
jgi:hypothetical protein